MQTFLPHPSFVVSVRCLDWRRLGKQRVEGRQMQSAIQQVRLHHSVWDDLSADDYCQLCRDYCAHVKSETGKRPGWTDHSCTVMWRNNVQALMLYTDCAIREWVRRGYQNTMPLMLASDTDPASIYPGASSTAMPLWLGRPELHASHRRRLLQKDYEWYSQFGWTEKPEGDYLWPRD